MGSGTETEDRARLTVGVREIGAPGAPGSLAVFAPAASAVVFGGSGGGSDAVVVATARLGRGRVGAFAHDGYFGQETLKAADTGRLLWNAIHWAGGDKPKPRAGLIDGADLRVLIEEHGGTAETTRLDGNLKGIDVLVLVPYHLSPVQIKRARAFVESGGGLLAAATGWGWQQGSKKPMAEFPRELAFHRGRSGVDRRLRRTNIHRWLSSHRRDLAVCECLARTETDSGRSQGQSQRLWQIPWRAFA